MTMNHETFFSTQKAYLKEQRAQAFLERIKELLLKLPKVEKSLFIRFSLRMEKGDEQQILEVLKERFPEEFSAWESSHGVRNEDLSNLRALIRKNLTLS